MRGAEERLAPILMTALVTGLALVPIVAGGDRSGHEIEHPMAVVILGGLVTRRAQPVPAAGDLPALRAGTLQPISLTTSKLNAPTARAHDEHDDRMNTMRTPRIHREHRVIVAIVFGP